MVERRPTLRHPRPRRAAARRVRRRAARLPHLRRLDAHGGGGACSRRCRCCRARTWSRTTRRRCSDRQFAGLERGGRPHDVREPGHGARHRHRQDRHLAALGLRDRLLPLSVPHALLLGDLRHPDAAGGGAHRPDLQGRGQPRHDQHLRRPDHPADRLGDRHVPVPPVLPDRARGAGRGGAHRRRRADALLQGHPGAAIAHRASRRCSSSSSSTAGTSTSGRCW